MPKQAKTDAKEAKKLGKKLSVIGHEEILNFLEKSLESGRLAHAYLFLGPEDVGKETVARWWLEKILHQGKEGGQRHSLETHPDVAVIERGYDEKNKKKKKLISIEQIRSLKEKLGLTSFLNNYKVALIREAGHMSIEASNALLKTLEEPSGKTILILLATDASRLPETIVSRCQIINFRIIPEKLIYDELRERGASREQAELLARLSAGSPGVALKFYEDQERLDNYKEEVRDFINICQAPVWQRFNYIDGLVPFRGDREEIIRQIKKYLSICRGVLRDALLVKLGNNDLMVNYWISGEIENLSKKFKPEQIVDFLERCKAAESNIDSNANIKLSMENFLLSF